MLRMAILIGAFVLGSAAATSAQTNPTYIQFQPRPVKGALYRPDTGPSARVAILQIHRTANVLGSPSAIELSRRGFLVLAMNPRSDNNEAIVNFEENALDIRSGIEFLRKQTGIQAVLLFGHSGGGAATTFYQAVAEQGPAYCQGAGKLVECPDTLAGLPKADGIVLMDAHPSNAINGLRDLNPAVIDEDPTRIDPSLNPFSPSNGYNPTGSSRYSDDFKRRYFEAQAARMNRLIDTAKARLARIQSTDTPYPDDDIFVVPRGEGARLTLLDPSIHHATIKPQKLLKNEGSVVTQIVTSVRVPQPELAAENASFRLGTRVMTLRSFLSANAIRATHSMDGIDWCSSNTSAGCALGRISVPVLIVAMGGYAFVRDNEILYEMASSRDKDFIVIEGATHGGAPCTRCETTPGQYSNTVRNFHDYVARWIGVRF